MRIVLDRDVNYRSENGIVFRRAAIKKQFHELIRSCGDDLTGGQLAELVEMVDRHGECRVALEMFADALFEKGVVLDDGRRVLMRSVLQSLGDHASPIRSSVSLLIWGFRRKWVEQERNDDRQAGWLSRINRRRSTNWRPVCALERKIIAHCPVCVGGLDFHCLHFYARVADTPDRWAETCVDSIVERRVWGEFEKGISTGNGLDEWIVWKLLSCPQGAGALLKCHSTVEMWDDDWVLAVARLTAEDFAACAGMVEHWLDL